MRSVTLKGTGTREDTIVRGSLCVPEGTTAKLSNFTLIGTILNYGQADLDWMRVSGQENAALYLHEGSLTTIDHSVIEGNSQTGVELRPSATATIVNSSLSSSDWNAVSVYQGSRLNVNNCVFVAKQGAIEGSDAHVELRHSDLHMVRGRRDFRGVFQKIGVYPEADVWTDKYTDSHEWQ